MLSFCPGGFAHLTPDEGVGYYVHGDRKTRNGSYAFKGFIPSGELQSVDVVGMSVGQTGKWVGIVVGMIVLYLAVWAYGGPPV